MSWPFTPTDRLLGVVLLAVCINSFWPQLAQAQSIESAIMPGRLIKGHADLEEKCEKCHVRFDRAAQQQLCLECHKPVAADVRGGLGFHGRLKEKSCRECHTEHNGRSARIVSLDEKGFDHTRTDFPLRGKHEKKACNVCHSSGVKHSKAPVECVACHRKVDKHKGNLGNQCGNCHDEKSWKETRFDHGKTKFMLRFAHDELACEKCHKDQRYTPTPRDCLSCHRADDTHKGAFGTRCETCHKENKWKQPVFQHDIDTRFRLLERHRTVRCTGCHQGTLYRQKTPTRCQDCHRKDDVHKTSLGDKCETCHTEKGWKGARFDHNRDTRFTLRDKHGTAKCESCHKPAAPHEKLQSRCNACHAEDDLKKGHKGRYGEKCESCHNEKGFKPSTFLHDRDTRFILREKHKQVKCDNCHKGPNLQEKLGSRCFACHERDDMEKGHKGRYGEKCETCHAEKEFKTTHFDHDRATTYPLTGKHRQAKCDSCHKVALGTSKIDKQCLTCHKADDVHFGSLDARCDQCHVTDDWRKVTKRDAVR